MNIEGEYRLAAPREVVWQGLNDAAILQVCVPGCQSLSAVSPTELEALIQAHIGPLRSTFHTRITLRALDPPTSYVLCAEGQGGAVGFGRAEATIELADDGAGTRLRYRADLKLGGRIAQLGSRLVEGATRKLAEDFFQRFAAHMAVETIPSALAPTPEIGKRGRRWWPWILGAAIALFVLWLCLRII